MKLLIYVAGLGAEAAREIQQEKKILADGDRLFAPFIRNDACASYTSRHSEQILFDLREHLIKDSQNEFGGHGVVVIFIKRDDISTERFSAAICPFLLGVEMAWEYKTLSPKTRRQSINELTALLRSNIAKARAAIKSISVETLQRTNTTPLLLPRKNFRSNVLTVEIENLFNALSVSQSPDTHVKEAVDAIKKAHPLKSKEGKVRWFQDDDGMNFHPPGRPEDRHGFANSVEGHPASCLIAGRLRLGAPFHRGFHYDCSKENTSFQRNLYTCHGDPSKVRVSKYVNIAPNDYVRLGKQK